MSATRLAGCNGVTGRGGCSRCNGAMCWRSRVSGAGFLPAEFGAARVRFAHRRLSTVSYGRWGWGGAVDSVGRGVLWALVSYGVS